MNSLVISRRYGSAAIALHWLMLVLIAGVFACMEFHEFFPKGSYLRSGLRTAHFTLGLCVLLLVLVRIAVRLTGVVPPIVPELPGWQMLLAKLMHLALYVWMLVMPLLGWLTLSAEGGPVTFFGLHVMSLVGKDQSLADAVGEIHETGAVVGYVLIGLHAAAALFHHYVAKDDTMTRIMPRRG